jgi:hypothetical protein
MVCMTCMGLFLSSSRFWFVPSFLFFNRAAGGKRFCPLPA